MILIMIICRNFFHPIKKINWFNDTGRPTECNRERRRPKSKYASPAKCREEVKLAEDMINNAGIFMLDSTTMSIEEIAVNIVKEKKLLEGGG